MMRSGHVEGKNMKNKHNLDNFFYRTFSSTNHSLSSVRCKKLALKFGTIVRNTYTHILFYSKEIEQVHRDWQLWGQAKKKGGHLLKQMQIRISLKE